MDIWPFFSSACIRFWATTAEMAPYLLLGFALAGILSVAVKPESVQRHLSGQGIWPVLKATLIGIPLPLCSCGVIPLAASLSRHGASRGATTAFLISTPQTGVDSIAVTYSLLGPLVAILRPLAALVTGVIGGYSVQVFADASEKPLVAEADTPPVQPDPAAGCTAGCCKSGVQTAWPLRMLRYALVTLPRDIGGAVLGGLVLAGLIAAVVPDDFFAQYLSNRWLAMIIMLLIGMPLYVCATGSVPIAAALVAKGISPGAAFVFLVAGPATNAAAMATLWRVLGKRSVLIYLVAVAAGALTFGFLLDQFFSGVSAHIPLHHVHHMTVIPIWKSIAAAILLLVLGSSVLTRLPWRNRSLNKKEAAV